MITFKKLIKHFLLLALVCCFNYANAQAGLGVSVDKTGGHGTKVCDNYSLIVETGFAGPCEQSTLDECNGDMFLMAFVNGIKLFVEPVTLTNSSDATCLSNQCYFNAIFGYTNEDFEGGFDCGDIINVAFMLVNSIEETYDLSCFETCYTGDSGPSNTSFSFTKCCESTNGPNDLVGDATTIIEGDDQRSASSTQNTSFFNNINNTLNLKVISKVAAVIPVQIFSLNGQKVHDQKVAITNGLNEVEISLNHLNDGLYISHTMIDGKAKVIKFAVNK